MPRDSGLDVLLNLAGEIYDQGDGYWIKIEAWRVAPTPQVPHGIRYSLTLHAPDNERILGFDNAHLARAHHRRFVGRRIEFDHRHADGAKPAVSYEFTDPEQLLKDFFDAVDQALAVRRR